MGDRDGSDGGGAMKVDNDGGNKKPKMNDKSESNCHAFAFYSAQFGIDAFFGSVYALITPFMTSQLMATKDFISGFWMSGPVAGLIIGFIIGTIIMRLGDDGSPKKRDNLLTIMVISFFCVVVSLAVFVTTPLISAEWGMKLETVQYIAVGAFFILMIAMNFYMQSFWKSKNAFSKMTVSKFAGSIWSAFGSIVAMMLIKFFPDYQEPFRTMYIFGIACAMMGVSMLVHLYAVYLLPIENKKKDEVQNKKKDEIQNKKKNENESMKTSCCEIRTCCKQFGKSSRKSLLAFRDFFYEGGLTIGLIIFFAWSSLFSFMPNATDWYARDIRHETEGKGYDDAVKDGSLFLLCLLGTQAVVGILLAVLNIFMERKGGGYLEDKTDYSGVDEGVKYHHVDLKNENLRFQVVLNIICLGVFSSGLFILGKFAISGTSTTISLIAGFVCVGFGPVVIFGSRELQRAYFRVARFNRNGEQIMHYKSYDERDSNYDVLSNNFLVLGQIFTLGIQTGFSHLNISTSYLIFYVGGIGGAVSLSLVVASLFTSKLLYCFVETKTDEQENDPFIDDTAVSAKPVRFHSNNLKGARSRIVFRTQLKSHHL